MVTADMVEGALKDLFTADRKMVSVEIGALPMDLPRPGINVGVVSGKLPSNGARTSEKREQLDITIVVVVKNFRTDGEGERRKEAHPLVRLLIQKVWLETLDLNIEPIDPYAWDETTNVEQLSKGLLVMEIKARTFTSFRRLDRDDLAPLLDAVLASYNISPDTSEDPALTDNITLTTETTP